MPRADAPRTSSPAALLRTSVWSTAGLALVLLMAQAALLVALEGGVSQLVRAAPPFADAASTPRSLTVRAEGEGFDGQFFFRQALAPLSTAEQVAGITFDLPALRSARVGYPLTAGALALGQPSLLPWTLLGLNVLAGAALALAVAALARDAGRSAAWGLAAVAYPGFVYTLGFDLAELVVAALLAAGLLALRRQHALWAALAWSGAVLTRETAAVLPLAALLVLGVQVLRHRRLDRRLVVVATLPLAVLALWQASLWTVFGQVPLLSSGEKNVGLPLAGLVSSADAFRPDSIDGLFRLVSLAALAALVVLGARMCRSPDAQPLDRAALLGAATMTTLISPFVWAGATSFMRAGTELGLVVVVLAVSSTSRARWLVPPLLVATTLLTLASQVVKQV